MKILLLSISTLLFLSTCFGQITRNMLDYNNSEAMIANAGVFFMDEFNTRATYKVPKNSQAAAIFASAFWFGGKDAQGKLYVSGTMYSSNKDIFGGPYSSNNSYSSSNYLTYSSEIWEVYKYQINEHKLKYNQTNYVMPEAIYNWPAHGDVSLGMNIYLAPFIDTDANGIYEPEKGDYPDIRGDVANYVILNDDKGPHTNSTGEALGIEVHLMFYQYATSDDINNTTFINARVINRGGIDFTEFKMGLFMDSDLGNYNDDYMGSQSTKQLVYTYNADNDDENNAGLIGYGVAPPAIGIKSLNTPMKYAGCYSGDAPANEGDPTNAADFWNALNGKFKNGTAWSSPFRYNGNPAVSTTNTEFQNGDPQGDRRMTMVLNHTTFKPNKTICEDFAVIYARGSSNLKSVAELIKVADKVQDFYDNQSSFSCLDAATATVEENKSFTATCYPTITSNMVTVQLNNRSVSEIALYDNMGRLIESKIVTTNETDFSLQGLQNGVYLIKVGEQTLRVIKQ